MKVIAGLGNPGAEYASTPHSIGFEVVDAVAKAIDASWKRSSSFKGEIATAVVDGQKVMLVKPQTFMNLSGECIAPVLKYHNATAADLVVVSDDIDLPTGKLRIRKGGSAGGHNGLKSVIEKVGTQDFIRLRLGVGREGRSRSSVIGHVLGKFTAADRTVMDEVVAEAKNVVGTLFAENVETVMNRYNGWVAPSAESVAGKDNDK
jgi:PTH1 family peptidyl-tRNA hydrolase